MSTRLVNVSVKNIRPKYKNLKEWMEDKDNIYIGRKGVVFIDNERYPKFDSPFANPFKIKKTDKREKKEEEEQEKEREIVLKKYQKYIFTKQKLFYNIKGFEVQSLKNIL